MRGKEGGGPASLLATDCPATVPVSVPLRGKEGGGPDQSIGLSFGFEGLDEFPSPCGVRRVGDPRFARPDGHGSLQFPSPCGVRRVGDRKRRKAWSSAAMDPPVSVPLRGKEGGGLENVKLVVCDVRDGFPSPCGVRRVGDPWFLETLYDAVFKVRF